MPTQKKKQVVKKNPAEQGPSAPVKPVSPALQQQQRSLSTQFSSIIRSARRVAPEMIDAILADSLKYRASDIHFEPQPKEVLVRFRVDGVLQEAGRIPREHYENILNRIKVLAHLRTDEHFSAQDGSIRYEHEQIAIDMRISIIPILDGEKIAIRLLHGYIKQVTLDNLGFSKPDQEIMLAASQKPFGMILVTGPTGSGKTTTLYALLNILNRPGVNITTIEDPVEYKIAGANQIQVNIQTNLTFAKGLRSIVRQDPDIVLVGEIRDHETAEIAVNAALTGHLLLSTFHANDAATAVPRLLDMDVEPFLLTSTLEVIIAQRLVRKLCEECRSQETVTIEQLSKQLLTAKEFFPENRISVGKSKGCTACGQTGYKGRIGIFEFIPMSSEMQELILKNPSTQQMRELARKQGSHSLFEDGIQKVQAGITTLEEVLRVAEPPTLSGYGSTKK